MQQGPAPGHSSACHHDLFPPPALDHERIRNLDWREQDEAEEQGGETKKTLMAQEPPAVVGQV